MGNETSSTPPSEMPPTLPQPTPEFPYFSLTFQRPNMIQLVAAMDDVIDLVRKTSLAVFSGCLLDTMKSDIGYYRFHYTSEPFIAESCHEEAVFARQLSTRLLKALYAEGWNVIASSLIGRYIDNNTWFFQRVCIRRPEPSIISISLSSTDSLQMIDCPKYIFEAIVEAAKQDQYGAKVNRVKSYTDMINNVEFIENLWNTSSLEHGILARRLILTVFRVTYAYGYRLYTTADVKNTADTLYMIREPDQSRENADCASSRFCAISLNITDTLRMIDCPQGTVEVIGRTVQGLWKVMNEGVLNVPAPPDLPAYRIQLENTPWSAEGHVAVDVRFMLMEIMRSMLAVGWGVVCSLDLQRGNNDKAVFIFRSCAPQQARHACLSMIDADELHVIPSDPDFVQLIANATTLAWPPGFTINFQVPRGVSWTLGRKPWSVNHDFARILLLFILQNLCDNGWLVICSADVSTRYWRPTKKQKGTPYKIDPDSWFLVHMGAPS